MDSAAGSRPPATPGPEAEGASRAGAARSAALMTREVRSAT